MGFAVLLSGCAELFGSDEPATPPGASFVYNGVTWMVVDDTATGTLGLFPATPQVPGPGTLGGYRLAVSAEALPTDEYRAAAVGWLAHTGRFCTVGSPVQGQDSDGFLGSSGDSDEQAGSRIFSYRCDWLP